MMLVAVCPTAFTADESSFTLQFATRARKIDLPPAKRNVETKNLEERLKGVKADVHKESSKRESAEKELNALKKDHKKSQQKMAHVLDARVRSMDELRKGVESQVREVFCRWRCRAL